MRDKKWNWLTFLFRTFFHSHSLVRCLIALIIERSVLLVRLAVALRWRRVVCHVEESVGRANKLVNIALACNCNRIGARVKQTEDNERSFVYLSAWFPFRSSSGGSSRACRSSSPVDFSGCPNGERLLPVQSTWTPSPALSTWCTNCWDVNKFHEIFNSQNARLTLSSARPRGRWETATTAVSPCAAGNSLCLSLTYCFAYSH